MNFLHTFEPQRVLLALGPITIYWYGLFVTSGVVAGILITLWLARRYDFNQDKFYNFIFFVLIFGFIGDRLFHVLYELEYYLARPFNIFKVWQGGLAIHGAMIGGILTALIYSRSQKLGGASTWWNRFWLLADICVVALAVGEAMGRWGNYFNQELYGLPTDSIIGIPIALMNRVSGYEMFEYFLPAFLFQSVFAGLIFVVLLAGHRNRIKMSNVQCPMSNKIPMSNDSSSPSSRSGGQCPIKNPACAGRQESNSKFQNLEPQRRTTDHGPRTTNYGNIFLTYLILYGIGRFIIEFIRLDPQPVLLGLRLGQIASIGLIIAAGVLFWIKKTVDQRSWISTF